MLMVIVVGTDVIRVGARDCRIAEARVGGLTLLGRAVRAAQVAGAERVLVVGPDRLRAAVLRDSRVRIPVEWHASDLPLARAVEAVLRGRTSVFPKTGNRNSRSPSPFFLTADRVVSPAMLPRAGADGSGCAVVVGPDSRPIGPVACSLEDLERRRDMSLDAVAEDMLIAGEARVLTVPQKVPARPIRSDGDRRAAHRQLFAGLKKPLGHDADGIVAYYVNRRISLQMSRVLVHTPVTPNQISALAMVLGLVAAALVATGQWGWMVVAGLVLQVASVIDGVDGEIARLKLCMSRSGEWFDTVCDDVTSIAFFAGVGLACHLRGAPWAATATIGGAASWIVLDALLYRDLLRAGHASHNQNPWVPPTGKLARVLVLAIAYLGKRDFYTVILLALLVLDLPAAAFALMLAGVVAALAALVAKKLRTSAT